MAINNFLQFNPGAVSQETDSAYTSDSTRTGGITSGIVADPLLHNKMFHQWSTFITAFAQSMANKGYDMSDADLPSLIASMTNIITQADVVGSVKNLTAYTQTGDTASHTIYSLPIPAMTPTQQLRIFLPLHVTKVSTIANLSMYFGGVPIMPVVGIPASQTNTYPFVEICGGNLGTATVQSWDVKGISLTGVDDNTLNEHTDSAINTAVAQNLTVVFQANNASDSITFYKLIVELIP